MAQVILKDVTKIYDGGVKAVHEFNLHIADGEFVVFVGPSGCGKSTTLRMIAGLEEITGGTIDIGGRIVNDIPPKDRNIAMVFQSYALYPHMNCFENMAFGLELRRMPRSEITRRVDEAAKILGITHLLDRKPKALSGGQRQRVAVGRAIVRDPACFLFDVPLSNLDAKLRVEMRAELKRLHQRLKTTTVYVTHDQEEAMTLGDRIVVMRDGIVQQCDKPLVIYQRPANRFVAGFVGTPPMNFMEGMIQRTGDIYWFVSGTDRLRLPTWAVPSITERVAHEVVLGIRPEAISDEASAKFANEAAGNGLAFMADVVVVEPLGDKMDVTFSTATQPALVARVDARPGIEPGMTRRVFIDGARLHLFEPGPTGVCLTSAAESALAR